MFILYENLSANKQILKRVLQEPLPVAASAPKMKKKRN